MSLDSRDRRILDILQHDADTSVLKIAEKVALSPSACSRRIAHLREAGFIRRTVALLDRDLLSLRTTIYVVVRARHSETWLQNFRAVISEIPEILECHRLAGNFDYLMKLVVADVQEYDRVYKRLVSRIELDDVSAYIAMEAMKDDPTLPIATVL